MIREEYLLAQKDLFNAPSAQKHWDRGFKQAVRHTRHSSKKEMLKKARPNEDDTLSKYREDNYHEHTYGPLQKFIAKSIRIIQNTGIKASRIDDLTVEYLNTNPFYYSGQRLSFEEWWYQCVYPYSFDDANGVLLAFPYNSTNYNIAPAAPVSEGGLPDNQQVSVEHRIIPYTEILHLPNELISDENYFSWHGGMKRYEQFDAVLQFAFVADELFYYTWEPVRKDQQGQIIYGLIPWYFHNTGAVPINILAGKITLDEHNRIKYKESFFKPALGYFDDFIDSYSDSKVSRVRFNYPKEVIAEMPCPNSGCVKGHVPTTNKDGEVVNKICDVCHGSGQLQSPGPFSTLIVPSDGMDANKIKDAYALIHPPTDGLKFAYDCAFDLLQKGKHEIGIDVMEKMAESGTAKEHRLEDLQDILNMIGSAHIDCQERHLWHITCLLNTNINARVEPKIDRPKSYALKSLEMLRSDAESAPKDDRFHSRMTYYRSKYKGQDDVIRVHELAIMWAPILLDTEEEINYKHQRGLYTDQDLIKCQYAIFAFDSIAKTSDIVEMSDRIAFELADKYLIDLGLVREEVVIRGDDGEPIDFEVVDEQI